LKLKFKECIALGLNEYGCPKILHLGANREATASLGSLGKGYVPQIRDQLCKANETVLSEAVKKNQFCHYLEIDLLQNLKRWWLGRCWYEQLKLVLGQDL